MIIGMKLLDKKTENSQVRTMLVFELHVIIFMNIQLSLSTFSWQKGNEEIFYP